MEVLSAWLHDAKHIVFFGGAGVSTESGIPDFRGTDGLYNKQYSNPPETILSHDFFVSHTKEFFRFYRERMLYPDAEPNGAHLALAALEKAGKLDAVVTQNIDGLHQAAGSRKVLELHGNVHRNYCMHCGKLYGLDAVTSSESVPHCACGGILKPDVVLYQEPLDDHVVNNTLEFISSADLLIVGGTSLAVYPAAGFLQAYRGSRMALINLSPTPYDRRANLILREPVGKTLSTLCSEWMPEQKRSCDYSQQKNSDNSI
ncbi:MAG: NAD-dependent protein deacylase [Christensenellales bacterium]|jgi:NAD-dependent deacetylase